jgi:hypothetical protein
MVKMKRNVPAFAKSLNFPIHEAPPKKPVNKAIKHSGRFFWKNSDALDTKRVHLSAFSLSNKMWGRDGW